MVEPGLLSRIERGMRARVGVDQILFIAYALDIDPIELMPSKAEVEHTFALCREQWEKLQMQKQQAAANRIVTGTGEDFREPQSPSS